MTEAANSISVDSIAKAVVKSSQDMGTLVLRLVNSRMMMRSVMKQQKHQVNMHQAQNEELPWPSEATRLKVMSVSANSKSRIIPTGTVRD